MYYAKQPDEIPFHRLSHKHISFRGALCSPCIRHDKHIRKEPLFKSHKNKQENMINRN